MISYDVSTVLKNKRYNRQIGIAQLMSLDPSLGSFAAMLKYDTEFAPYTTNRQMLLDIGVYVPNKPTNLEESLTEIITALAQYQIYFVDEDHLSDQELWDYLQKILDESVREIVGGEECHEIISLEDVPASSNKQYTRHLPQPASR